MGDHLLKFFTLMEEQGGCIVKELPKFDLDLYIQNYRGRTRFERLILIGRSSVPLCVDALKNAITEAKKGRDIERYREAVECLRIAAPNESETALDHAWMEAVKKSNKNEIHRLTMELKGYKNNLIKESVRMGNEDLGKHLESIGDLNGAAEAYARMRPDVSTQKQIVDVGKHLVRVSLQRREWAMVNAHLAKMGGMQGQEEEKLLQPYMKITQGIAYMGQELWLEAAKCFLEADSSIASTTYQEIASANDVAVYGGLLALVSMDRKELQRAVLDNSTFRTFLELEPHIRRAITQFVNGRYSACIATLEAHRPDHLLDIYLQKHIPKIYGKIRFKCIVQYLIPFSCVTLDTMEKAFGSPDLPTSIEDELVELIRDGSYGNARINSIDKLVTILSTNTRDDAHVRALNNTRNYEKQALDKLRRMSLAAADLELKGQKRAGQHAGNDFMFDQ